MEGKEQAEEERLIEETEQSPNDQQEKTQDSEDEESVPGVSSHTPPASASPEGGTKDKGNTKDDSGGEETNKKHTTKSKTGRKLKNKDTKKLVFPCNKCSCLSSSIANFKKHMMTHTGEKPHECHTCHKTFRQHHHLVDHLRTHTGERPYQCEVCDSRFTQKSSLNLHSKRHGGIKPFSCTECEYASYEKIPLIIHMRRHTGERPYQCETCGQTFSTATRLKFHRMIHTGERRYKCDKCGVPFREKVTLQAHMAVHLNLGPFVCDECGQEFSRLAGLSLHRKVHDNKDDYLYVYNKEASQGFESALKKLPTIKNSRLKRSYKVVEKPPSSGSDLETDTDDGSTPPSPGTPDHPGGTRCGGQGTPVTPTISPQTNTSPMTKISASPDDSQNKLKENLASNLKYSYESSESAVHPDQVREALQQGTVLETQGGDGKGFFIVLPPSLKNKDIMLLSDSQQSTTTTTGISDSTMKDGNTTFDGDISPSVLSEHVLESHNALYPGVVEEEVEECDLESVELEEEVCSEEGETIHQCEAESVECIFNTNCHEEVLDSIGDYSEAIEEHLHPDGTSLLLWKGNSVNHLTNVTYIIEDGKKEPIVIRTQDGSCVPGLSGGSSVKGKRKRKYKDESEGSHDLETGNYVKIKIDSKNSKIKKQRMQRAYTCEQCGKPCKNSSNYIAHLRTHSGERPYYCGVCRMGFKQISHLRSHIRVHTGERPYVCNLCNAGFAQSSRLHSHKRNVHPNGQTQIKKKKEKYIPEKRIKNFFCRYCNKTFIGECLKIDHMKLHRPPLPYGCKICGMQFKSKGSMVTHYMKHSDGSHVCEICGVTVPNLHELDRHRVTEHGRTLSNTDYINVRAGGGNDSIVLNSKGKEGGGDVLGIQVKSEGVGEPEVDLCEVKQEVIHVTDVDGSVESEIQVMSAQVKEEEMTVHDITHTSPQKHNHTNTQEEDEDSSVLTDPLDTLGSVEDEGVLIAKEREMKDRKFITYVDEAGKKVWLCKVCDRSFTQSSNLYCHMRMHTGAKPYRCNVCPRAFRQITHLKDHMRRHTGVKPHKCSGCGKCFTQKSALRRHIRMLHGGNAVALTEPEIGLTQEIIDTLATRYKQVTRGIRLRNALKRTNRLPHKENTSHVCKVCNKQFPQISRFNEHVRSCGKLQKIQKVSPVVSRWCDCGKSFTSVTRLLRHQETCSYMGEEEEEDDENEMEEAPNTDEEYEGNIRKLDRENKKTKTHTKRKHNRVKLTNTNTLVTQNQFKCKQCGEVCHGITSYKTHLQGHHGDEVQQVCMVCGEVFKRASALRYHQNMKHGQEDRRYTDFYATGLTKVHEQNPEEDVVIVKVEVDPEDSFYLSDEEEREEMCTSDVEKNTPVKPKKTPPKCKSRQDFKSSTKSDRNLKKTIRNTTHKDSTKNEKRCSESSGENLESNSYECSVCEMAFTRSSKLRHHMAMWCKGHHRARTVASTTTTTATASTSRETHTPHTENSTSKVNKVDSKLEKQMKKCKSKISENTANARDVSAAGSESLVSKGDKNVPTTSGVMKKASIKQSAAELYCKSCDQRFTDQSSCEKHLRSHADEKPFECEHCLMRFKRKAHLFNHYRVHAREESV